MSRAPRLDIRSLDCGALRQVSLTVDAGACVAISGPSGAGKTRLLRALADLDPSPGAVFLNGRSREDHAPSEWRRRVTLLPSDSLWWGERVCDSAPGLTAEALQALDLPAGAGTWSVDRLSAGERQRLALLRVAALEPEVFLLDEPTANLDADNARRVEDFLAERRRRGAALIWVSHDPAQIQRVADRSMVIRDGRLEEAP